MKEKILLVSVLSLLFTNVLAVAILPETTANIHLTKQFSLHNTLSDAIENWNTKIDKLDFNDKTEALLKDFTYTSMKVAEGPLKDFDIQINTKNNEMTFESLL